MKLRTLLVHAGSELLQGDPYRPLVPPVYLATAFQYLPGEVPEAAGRPVKYSREENPTTRLVEAKLASLHGAGDSLLYSSGMAAIAALLVWGRSRSYRRLLLPLDSYSATTLLARRLGSLLGYEVVLVEPGWENLASEIGEESLVLVETVSNALLRVYDVEALAREAARTGALLAVDNTVATPVNHNPFEHGAALALYSATKHLAGHNDVVAGALITRDRVDAAELWEWRRLLGTAAHPLAAYLLDRGLKTLHLRVEHHNRAALYVARRVREEHPWIRVIYPCLPDHPDHQVASRILRGCGSLVILDLGDRARAVRFLESLRLVKPSTSFGGAESQAVHLASGPASSLTPAERARIGLSEGMVRLHVGLENPEDVAADVVAAAREARNP